MSKDDEIIEVTILRAIMHRRSAGWIVNRLAYLQEEEEHNIDCADNLRGILAERGDVLLVDDEEALPFSLRKDPPASFGRTR